MVTNRPNGWRDRLAPDGSKTVAQEFGEGLPEIGERQHAGEVLINRDEPKDIQSTQPLPTIPLPRRSLQCASLPLASFEAPLSCLRAHPKHQGLRRSGRAAQSPSRYNRWAVQVCAPPPVKNSFRSSFRSPFKGHACSPAELTL